MICSWRGVPADRPQQPLPPGARLLGEAGVHQGVERERGVAQPAEAVVPVAHAAELLRQRGRRRGDDAAGRRVGQRLERDQRAQHRLATTRRCVRLQRFGPVLPTRRRSSSTVSAAIGRRGGSAGRTGDQVQDEGTSSPAPTVNSATVREVLARAARRGVQSVTASGPATARQAPSSQPPDPGHDDAVVEAQDQLHAHAPGRARPGRSRTRSAAVVAGGHAVDERRPRPRPSRNRSPGSGCPRGSGASPRHLGPAGAIASGRSRALPRRAAKQAAESKRGRQSQSMEPSRPTSAAVSQSPIRA